MNKEFLDSIIGDCRRGFAKEVLSSSVLGLARLLQAEDNRLIDTQWRKEIDVDKVTLFINHNLVKVEKEWYDDFEKLKRIIDFGGRYEYEEMMLILFLRSSLESYLRFLSNKEIKKLDEIAENFSRALRENKNLVEDCHTHVHYGIEKYFPRHWWWRPEWETKLT